mmetsp:Transcript_30894/g.80700  ORF Transcript_30894/g.80700 Transcript_30894/m.80700 type:complete len:229 (+) Transcript_30894:3414-4100(+)
MERHTKAIHVVSCITSFGIAEQQVLRVLGRTANSTSRIVLFKRFTSPDLELATNESESFRPNWYPLVFNSVVSGVVEQKTIRAHRLHIGNMPLPCFLAATELAANTVRQPLLRRSLIRALCTVPVTVRNLTHGPRQAEGVKASITIVAKQGMVCVLNTATYFTWDVICRVVDALVPVLAGRTCSIDDSHGHGSGQRQRHRARISGLHDNGREQVRASMWIAIGRKVKL